MSEHNYSVNLDISLLRTHRCKLYPLKIDKINLPDCDTSGKPLNKISGSFKKAKYFYEDKKEYTGTPYKLIKGQARAKFKRTKEIPNAVWYDEDKIVNDLITERYFFVDCDTLKDEFEEHYKQALYFVFSFGKGYQIWEVVVYFDERLNCLIAKFGLGSISKKIKEIVNETISIKDKAIIMDSEEVDRVNPKEMIELLGV